MKRLLAGGLAALLVIVSSSCNRGGSLMNNYVGFHKEFNKVKSYGANIPESYQFTDYKAVSKLFDDLVFDFDATGDFLPLIWDDRTNDSFGMPAYVGDGRMGNDGEQEGVTAIAAVLYASLNGTDKSNQHGKDYVQNLNAFFSEDEGIILNNPNGSSKTTSMWYLLYPAILYAQVSALYENQETMRQNTLKTIESWYSAYQIMYDLNREQPDFDYTGFDFTTMMPYRNNIWKEPDCAVGMSVLFKYGYELTGNEEYLSAIIILMDYIESFFGGPQYEALMYFAPALVAELNTLHGTSYDITKSLNRVFDGASIPRGGWGSISGKWGDYEVNGLFGSTTDGGGYAFAMNTFAAAGAVAPMARYDSRYARSIGKWLLHLHNNARYFFAGETIKENQSVTFTLTGKSVPEKVMQAVPYEGIRKESNGKSPWFGGDPTVYGWAQTDFSLYSGAHTGILGLLYEQTNQEAILKVDLLATETPGNPAYPTYLIYNPHKDAREITYRVNSPTKVDLFDTVTNSIVASGVEKETSLTIQPDDAVVIVEIPAGSVIDRQGVNYFVGGRYISGDKVTLSIAGAENNDTVSGKVTLTAVLTSNFDDEIEQTTLSCEGKDITFSDKITLSKKDFGEGAKQMQIKTTTKAGLSDETTLRLIFN